SHHEWSPLVPGGGRGGGEAQAVLRSPAGDRGENPGGVQPCGAGFVPWEAKAKEADRDLLAELPGAEGRKGRGEGPGKARKGRKIREIPGESHGEESRGEGHGESDRKGGREDPRQNARENRRKKPRKKPREEHRENPGENPRQSRADPILRAA